MVRYVLSCGPVYVVLVVAESVLQTLLDALRRLSEAND
jgi:hypothetical protein